MRRNSTILGFAFSRFLLKIKDDPKYRRKSIFASLLISLFMVILVANYQELLNLLVVGIGEDINSVEILQGVIIIYSTGWNLVLLGLMTLGTIIFSFGFAREDLARIGLTGIMNGVVYLSAISLYIERLKPIFFTIPLFFMVVIRVVTLLKSNKKGLVILLKKWSIPLLIFILLFLIFSIGIVQILVGSADVVRSAIPIFQQVVAITPYFHAFIFFLVLILNEWEIKEFEKYFKSVLFLGIILFVESLVAFYFQADFLRNISISHILGMFSGAFLGGYHKVARIAIVMGFIALYFVFRTRWKGYWIFFIMAIFIAFSALNRSAIGAFFQGIGLIVFQQSWSLISKMPKRKRILLISSSIVIFFGAGFSILWFATFVRDLAPFLEMGPEQLIGTFTGRAIILARSLDVFVHKFWTGTGPYNVTPYLASQSVPVHAFQKLYDWFGIGYEGATVWVQYKVSLFFKSRTAHNLWVNFLLEWGVFGALIIGYILYYGIRWFRKVWKLVVRGDLSVTPAWILLVLLFSLGLSLHFTIKFRYYSLFVILLLFIKKLIQEYKASHPSDNDINFF